MSCLLSPQAINTIRGLVDMTIDHLGFDCDLYIPKPQVIPQRETLDVYMEKPALEDEKFEAPIKTRTFIEWKPDTKRLRNLGIFTEENLPILAWFKGLTNLTRNAWIRIELGKDATTFSTDEFELVDCVVKHMYNAVVVQAWLIAPRRH